METKTERLSVLDGVRGLAALAVVIQHLPGWVPPYPLALAVPVFFCLSGFLITRILLADKESGRGVGQFYWRRSVRILPIYIIALAACVPFQTGPGNWMALTYTMNFRGPYTYITGEPVNHLLTHTWTLSIEEQFYILWPLLVAAFPTRTVAKIAAWGLAVPFLAVPILNLESFDGALLYSLFYGSPVSQFSCLFTGAIIAIYERGLRTSPKGCAVAGAILFVAGMQWMTQDWLSGTARMWYWYTFCSTGVILLSLAVCWSDTAAKTVLSHWTLTEVGKRSYGLYLWHGIIFSALGMIGINTVVTPERVLTGVGLTILATWFSWRFIEAPLLRWRDSASRPKDQTAASATEQKIEPQQ